MNQAANGKSMLESRLVELQEENELLWRQLHDVQEELDRHFLKNQAIENPRGTKAQTVAWVDDEWLASVAEVQRLRTIVAETPVAYEGRLIQMTMSIGITELAQSDGDSTVALARADKALYLAKDQGRNRVVATPI
jgi:GGDEF domain-containing protein